MNTYISTYPWTPIYPPTHEHLYIHLPMNTYISTYPWTPIYPPTHEHIYIHLPMNTYISTYPWTPIYPPIHTHTHTHTHTRARLYQSSYLPTCIYAFMHIYIYNKAYIVYIAYLHTDIQTLKYNFNNYFKRKRKSFISL